MFIKFILIALILVILVGIAFFTFKMHQLKKLENMTSMDVIHYVTKNNKDIKLSVAIIKNGEITYQIYGNNSESLSNTDYEYEIGSISKTFAGLLLSKAIEEGRVHMNAPVSEYLELDQDKIYPTIEQLVTHTSGYKSYYLNAQMIRNQFHERNDFYGTGKEAILKQVKNINLENKNYGFRYSNFGISVAGLVLEKVYHKDFVTLMNDFIRNDLKLEHTKTAACTGNLDGYWNWKENDGYIPAGAIISNIEDMASYLKFYMESEQAYVTNTYACLKPVNFTNTFYEKLNIRIDQAGITWMIDEKNDVVWHNGGTGSFNSYIAFNRDKNIGVVVLGNLSPEKKIPMTVIGAYLMKELKSR